MFDRFIRLARAKKALHEQRFEDALQLAHDPMIAADRRAENVRTAAADALLQRARQRLEAGDAGIARAAAQRVRAAGDPRAAEVLAAIDAAVAAGAASVQAAKQAFGEARAAIDAGDLTKADAVLATRGDGIAAPERQQLVHWIAERRRQAAALVEQGERALGTDAVGDALETLARAELLDRDHAGVAALRRAISERGAGACARVVTALLKAGDVDRALPRYGALVRALPALRQAPPMVAVAGEVEDALLERLRAETSLPNALALAQAAADSELPLHARAEGFVAALVAVPQRRDDAVGAASDVAAAWATVARHAADAGATALARAATARREAFAAGDERLAAAKASVDRGDLDAARAELTALLAAEPLHAGARRELELLDQSCADLDRRLVDARAALRAGRLREACAIALALGGHARVAGDAQQLLTQARAGTSLVDRGLDEVRVALHGRAAATQEGVRHCLLRLEELGKVQVDHGELPNVVAAVQAELRALGVVERAGSALERRAASEALAALDELFAARPSLLTRDRLDARLCELADRTGRLIDVALASGRLADVEPAAAAFAALEPVRADFAARAAQWRTAAAERCEAAGKLVADARVHLAERDLADAERLVEQAVAQWSECAEARALGSELQRVRAQSDVLERVDELTRERDYAGAQQKLGAMHAASPLLRTRIYDMKQNLARAQGLEGAFLLRVDEGGEQLVLRGESVTIGNVRQMRADLPVLANLAGRHASIRRSMSFHGGMQDTIVAEEGEVRVGGSMVRKHALAPGDRVQLGPALGFVYQRPTGRSLTVGIVLQSGFQVAGTDRVLLMKDRGRDGRILLGPGQDVHVRVHKATGEVEVFTTSSGQMRVACAAGGTIDGVPFRGEHPVDAGQIVVAAGVSMVLLPWRPAA